MSGLNIHLSKPIYPGQLFSTMESLLWEKDNKEGRTHG